MLFDLPGFIHRSFTDQTLLRQIWITSRASQLPRRADLYASFLR